MLVYYAGLRRAFMRSLRGFPPRVLFTFDDVSPYGGGEQKTLFRDLLMQRGIKRESIRLGVRK